MEDKEIERETDFEKIQRNLWTIYASSDDLHDLYAFCTVFVYNAAGGFFYFTKCRAFRKKRRFFHMCFSVCFVCRDCLAAVGRGQTAAAADDAGQSFKKAFTYVWRYDRLYRWTSRNQFWWTEKKKKRCLHINCGSFLFFSFPYISSFILRNPSASFTELEIIESEI